MGKAKLGSSAWQGIQHGKQEGAEVRGRLRSVLAPPCPQQGPLYLPTPCSCHLGPTYYTINLVFLPPTPAALASHSLFPSNDTPRRVVSLTPSELWNAIIYLLYIPCFTPTMSNQLFRHGGTLTTLLGKIIHINSEMAQRLHNCK